MLCLGGDWACTQPNFATLGDFAARLVEYEHEPLHCELVTLSELCRCDPDHAVAAWYRMKELVRASCGVQP